MLHIVNHPQGFDEAVARMEACHILSRLWAHDFRLWSNEEAEISNRLGWLHLPETMPARVDEIEQFAAEIREEGFEHVLLLGMGGSSLAPETFSLAFEHPGHSPRLHVLDSTHPDAIRTVEGMIDLEKTLTLVATKSGTTTETLSLFRYIWNRIASVDADAPRHFVAITDPGSPLTALAKDHGFRRVFENDPDVGGRFSALSHFGLVPACLIGVDARELLRHAQEVARACTRQDRLEENPAVRLGALLGVAAKSGRNKATLILSDPIASFGDWIEQLIAESTGKEGRGILPVVGEELAPPSAYGHDRLFVHVRLAGDGSSDDAVGSLANAGHPVVRVDIEQPLALGGQFFLWEMATAIAGHILQINPFDQPNVESSKALSREMVATYRESGNLPELPSERPTPDVLRSLLDGAADGAYVALQAYVPPTEETGHALSELRTAIRDAFGTATTAGFGPRFLHSTGQLHKGDAGRGLFVQFVTGVQEDLDIPSTAGSNDSSLTFGTLIAAQAAGDREALMGVGRRALTIRLDVGREAQQIRKLAEGLAS